MKARIFLLSFLLLTACQPVELDNEYQRTVPESKTGSDSLYSLTIKATIPDGTKALYLDGTKMKAYWRQDDIVNIFRNGVCIGTLTANPDPNGGEKPRTATLSGSLKAGVEIGVGDKLWLLFPGRNDEKWDYTGQNGTLTGTGSIEDNFDYASAMVDVASVDKPNKKVVTTGIAAFTNEQTMYRFDFKVGGSARTVKQFSITSNRSKLVRSRSWSSDKWTSDWGKLTVVLTAAASSPYMSLLNENTTEDDTYTFNVVGGDDALYVGTKVVETANLGVSKFLAPQVSLTLFELTQAASGQIDKQGDVL